MTHRVPKGLLAFVTFILGTAFLIPIIEANVQEWARTNKYDQYLLGEGPGLSTLASFTQSPWFTFFLGFFIGGTTLLWLDYWLRGSGKTASNVAPVADGHATLAHGLHLTGMAVAVDKAKKVVQIGFTLSNATDVPLRYEVQHIAVIVEGKTVAKPEFENRGGVVARGAATTFRFAPIPHVMGRTSADARSEITYRYGPAAPDAPYAREANYTVSQTIGTKDNIYTILAENDGAL